MHYTYMHKHGDTKFLRLEYNSDDAFCSGSMYRGPSHDMALLR